MIGEDGILKELELAGFQYLGGPVYLYSISISSVKNIYSKVFNFEFQEGTCYVVIYYIIPSLCICFFIAHKLCNTLVQNSYVMDRTNGVI